MFRGSLPAMVTPFNNGEVDVKGLRNLVNWHIEQGSHGLVPVGTTGESPTLTHTEHEQVVSEVINEAAGRVPVIAGAGSNNTAEAIRFVEHAKNVGANAALVVTPYNIPGRSVVDMSPETMGELAKLNEIIGVKDATGDLARVCDQRLTCGDDFIQLSGEDATAHGFNAQGGVGCISVTANVAPGLCSRMQEATLAGDYSLALKIQDKLMPLHKAIFTEPGLVGAKYAMNKLGLCKDEVRLPLTPLSEPTKQKINSALKHADLI